MSPHFMSTAFWLIEIDILRMEVIGKPVKLQLSTALGAFVPQSFKGMLDRIGIKPSKWF